jgi:hypothetical protein
MRFRFNKKKYASLILIFLMLLSTVSFGLLQSIRGLVQPTETEVNLPDTNIVNYQITAEQKNRMIKIGKTILEYRYRLGCTECSTQRAYIESAVAEFPDQIFLEELVDNSVSNSTLSISSYYGEKHLNNPSNEDILDKLCELMIEPPIICATRNI